MAENQRYCTVCMGGTRAATELSPYLLLKTSSAEENLDVRRVLKVAGNPGGKPWLLEDKCIGEEKKN